MIIDSEILVVAVSVGIVVLILLVGFFFVVGLRSKKSGWQQQARKQLFSLQRRSQSRDLMTMKMVVMEYDKLLDFVLASRGARGNTLGERLKSSRKLFSNYSQYDQTWKAHKLRNRLAHDVNYTPHPQDLNSAAQAFYRSISSLIN